MYHFTLSGIITKLEIVTYWTYASILPAVGINWNTLASTGIRIIPSVLAQNYQLYLIPKSILMVCIDHESYKDILLFVTVG